MFDFSSGLRYTALSADGEFSEAAPESGRKVHPRLLVDDLVDTTDIDEFVVISNHKFAQHFEDWKSNKQKTRPYEITVIDDGTSTNETRLGAVKDIQLAVEKLNLADDLLVMAGDNVLDFSLSKFVAYAQQKKTSCIMRYYEPEEKKLMKCGVVELDDQDKILPWKKSLPSPRATGACPPSYVYTRADARKVKDAIAQKKCGTDAPGSFIAWLCTVADVHAMEMPGKRYDIGNLESYQQVQQEYQGIKA